MKEWGEVDSQGVWDQNVHTTVFKEKDSGW